MAQQCNSEVSAHDKEIFSHFLLSYADVFATPQDCLGRTTKLKHNIDTGFSSPIRQAVRRIPPHRKEEVSALLEDMLKKDIIQPSCSLCNAPATFQRLMDLILAGLQWSSCLVYLDDIIIVGKSFENHLSNIKAVLDRIREAGLKLQPAKCKFFRVEVPYLGHIVSKNGVSVDPSKVQTLESSSKPSRSSAILGTGKLLPQICPRLRRNC